MTSFTILLLPVALFLFFQFSGEKKYLTTAFTGLFTGIFVCGIRFIFFFSHRLIPDSFIQNYLFYLIRITLLPMLVYGVFVLITKASVEFKIRAFFPLLAGFGCIYYPYFFLTMSGSVYTGYDLFFRPVIYLSMLILFSLLLKRYYDTKTDENKQRKILIIVLMVLCLLFPSFVDASYVVNKFFCFFTILGIVYAVCSVVLMFFSKVKLIVAKKAE